MRRRTEVPTHRRTAIALALLFGASVRPCAGAPVFQCPDGTPPPCRAVRTAAPVANSVAVLYFENASRDTADQYLADGITEEIATSLGRIARLHVISPAAVRRALQASGGDAGRLARILGVRHIVEGSVRRAGSQARITARLLASDGRTQLWTDAYTRPTADLLALEEEIAQRVATGVVGTLLPDERRSLATAAVDAAAHDHVLRGNFQFARRTEASIRRAINEYDAAVVIDSSYAIAWGQLALANAILTYWAERPSRAEIESLLVRGERAATHALELDSTLANAWSARGYLRANRDPIRMTGVLDALRHAVALDPRSAEAHHQLGAGYMWHGDAEHARPEFLRALELEPGRLVSYVNMVANALLTRHYDEMHRYADSAIALEPMHAAAYVYLMQAPGDSASALRAGAKVDQLGGQTTPGAGLCMARALIGPSAATRAACARFLANAVTPSDSAIAYRGLGDAERAMTSLESIFAQRTPLSYVQLLLPFWDVWRDNPRFQRIVETARPAEAPR